MTSSASSDHAPLGGAGDAVNAAMPPRFGRYRTVREIGRGGMGVMYEAVSDDEFRRRVAIKVAPLARLGVAAAARFRRERQILSSLDHPCIARFLDGGADGDVPYLVMEFVEGVPITTYVRAQAMVLADRLRLVQRLCSAVQYAHQRLVVHRDLKPSNILVGSDGTPTLLDFGVAKLLDSADDAQPTQGGAAWTPDYASPEQVTGQVVGTTTDIYSLGLVLYEVLTGARAQAVDTTSPLALSRSVCDVVPPRPSEAVAAAGEAGLARRLRGDLDTIVMTAIHKDPAQRYPSAAAVADDIERYLAGLPVEAHPPSMWYRTRKALRRHRSAVAAATLVTTAVCAGVVATAYEARRADRRFAQVRALANEFVFGVHDRIASLPGSTDARRALVQTALTYLEHLREDAVGDPGLARELAAAYVKIGRVQGYPLDANLGEQDAALASFTRAQTLLAPLDAAGDLDATLLLGRVEQQILSVEHEQGDRERTLQALAHALQLADRVLAARPDDPDALELIGDVSADRARYALEIRATDLAIESAQRAMEAADALVRLQPMDARRRNDLATANNALGASHLVAGRLRAAADSFRRAVAIREALVREAPLDTAFRRALVVAYGNVGDVLGGRGGEHLGDVEGALDAFERAVTLSRTIAAEDPKDRRAVFDLVNGLLRIGSVLTEVPQRVSEAVAPLEESDRLNTALRADVPGNARYLYLQVVIDRRLGRLYRVLGRSAEAERRLTSARAAAEKMFEGPSALSARQMYAIAGVDLAWLWAVHGDRRAAAAVDAARAAIPPAHMPPLLEAQVRGDLGRAFVALARRSATVRSAAASAVAEFDASVALWTMAATPEVARQRDRVLAELSADRQAAVSLMPR